MVKKHSAKLVINAQSKQVNEKQLIPEKYQDYFNIALIFLAVFIFFGPAIFGNGFYSSDTLASESFKNYIDQAKNDGEFPQWIPYIFSGMPGFSAMLTTGTRMWAFLQEIFFSIIGFVGILFASDIARLAFYYFIYGLGIYILMRTKDHDKFVAFFTSIAAIFSTAVIVWIMIGHNTKPVVFSMFPYVILLLEEIRKKFSLLKSALLILVIHIMMEAGHVQMIFYGILTFGLYLIFELISRLISKKEPLKVIRAAAVLIIAGAFAFLMSADRYLSTLEYTQYSTRGSAPIEKSLNSKQTADGGNEYDYATMWSYSPQEMILFLVPNYFGFGKLDYSGPATGNKEYKLPTYWGQKPFDDAAAYMGIIVFALAFIGFILNKKDVFVQFLLFISLFSLILSFGKNFSILYDFFYYYVPGFNKFRAPSMALAIMQFAVPILAGYGLSSLLSDKNTEKISKTIKYLLYTSLTFFGLGLLFSIIFKSAYLDAIRSSSNSSFQNLASQLPDIYDFIYTQMISDWLINAILLIIATLFLYYFIKNKLNKTLLYIALTALLLIDLWRVDFRPMEISDRPIEKKSFAKTDVIDFLKNDKSTFRVADLSQRETPNALAYFLIQNINGYHSAKLRIYQDLMDVANAPQALGSTSIVLNPFLWNLLNVKYILSNGKLWEGVEPIFSSSQSQEFIYYNQNMLPRAFYVDSLIIEKPINILHHLRDGDFKPTKNAFIENKLTENISNITENTIPELLQFKNHYIKLKTNSSKNKFMFISEIYYPDWKAFIDGKETKIYKTNYAFRGIVVPGGKHFVEMKYISPAFQTGKNLALASNILLSLLIIIGVLFEFKKNK